MLRRALLLCTTVLAGVAVLSSFALARDRPGTPNELSVWDCGMWRDNYPAGPKICVTFTNTASETVTFDIAVFEYERARMADSKEHIHCYGLYSYSEQNDICNGKPTDHRGAKEGFTVQNLRPDTTYCVEIYARRTSDKVISEIPARGCAHTAKLQTPPPTAPPTPVPMATAPPRPIHATGRAKSNAVGTQGNGIAGTWRMQTSLGGHFDFLLSVTGTSVTGMLVGIDSRKYDGTLSGSISADGRVVQFTFAQPQLKASGNGVLTMAEDGKTLEGGATMADSTKFTLKGYRM